MESVAATTISPGITPSETAPALAASCSISMLLPSANGLPGASSVVLVCPGDWLEGQQLPSPAPGSPSLPCETQGLPWVGLTFSLISPPIRLGSEATSLEGGGGAGGGGGMVVMGGGDALWVAGPGNAGGTGEGVLVVVGGCDFSCSTRGGGAGAGGGMVVVVGGDASWGAGGGSGGGGGGVKVVTIGGDESRVAGGGGSVGSGEAS